MSYPLPEKVNLAVEVKSDKSGKIVLAKDRFALVGRGALSFVHRDCLLIVYPHTLASVNHYPAMFILRVVDPRFLIHMTLCDEASVLYVEK